MSYFHINTRQLATWLLPVALFALGLWLGARLLPLTGVIQLYRDGAAALAATLPQSVPEDAADTTGLLLSVAGMPLVPAADDLQDALPAEVGDEYLFEESILILPPPEVLPEPTQADTEPQVVIYCTHTSEEYAGQSRKNGTAGGVMQAAKALAAAFEARGVGVILDETLHDSPSYDNSYASSLASVTALAEQYPDIEVYIDVHRDSHIDGLNTTLSTSSGNYAKMLLVVGSNEKLAHPNWQQNYQFAKDVAAAANQLQSGVMREPRLYSGRYNQHVATKAILVEIGSTDNSVTEAERSAELLAEAIIGCM